MAPFVAGETASNFLNAYRRFALFLDVKPADQASVTALNATCMRLGEAGRPAASRLVMRCGLPSSKAIVSARAGRLACGDELMWLARAVATGVRIVRRH